MENERPKSDALSALSAICIAVIALLGAAAMGYLFVSSLHDLGMMMLGNLRSGYDQQLYQHLLQGY